MTRKVCFISTLSDSLLIYDINLILDAYREAKKCKFINDVIIICNDDILKLNIDKLGYKTYIINNKYLNSTELIIYYLKRYPEICDIVINIKPDNKFIKSSYIDLCIKNYFKHKFNIDLNVLCTDIITNHSIKSTTLCYIEDKEIIKSQDVCKLVINKNNDIIYSSRNIISSSKIHEIDVDAIYYCHINIFVFEKEYLINEYMKNNNSNEKIEFLKIIDDGYKINVSIINPLEINPLEINH